MRFGGFPAAAFDFYAGLGADNSRTYWAAHRDVYEDAVRAPLAALLAELAGEFGGMVSLFRPFRDVRFSKDKSPYKTHQGSFAEIAPGVGYHLQVDADGLLGLDPAVSTRRLDHRLLSAGPGITAALTGITLSWMWRGSW
jgi:Conserved hypothetical protein (DUF2461)